jgi:regulator of replication initiation timing
MTNLNSPTSEVDNTPRKKDHRSLVIGLLAFGLVASVVYLIINQNESSQVIQQTHTQIAQISDAKSQVQKSFDESLVRLDSMTGISNGMRVKLKGETAEIAQKKAEIRRILNNRNATAAELAKAKDLIAQLNDKIGTMEQDVARLTTDNQSLTQDKVQLTQDNTSLTSDLQTTTAVKQDLEKKVDIASTLNASNIAIVPVDVRSNGKEKITSTAKRVNKLLISFDVTNRIAQSGMTDIYVCITGPDGKNIVVPAAGQDTAGKGTFTTREEGDKSFTAKVPVDFEMTQKKKVEFAFTPAGKFQQGSYKIQIYQNGYKIGEGTSELKKGGLFS